MKSVKSLHACSFHAGQGDGAHGLVLVFAGSAPSLASQNPSNVFICEQDIPYIDESSKPLHSTQKPAALFSKLIELYTGVGDWILDGTGGIGMVTHVHA